MKRNITLQRIETQHRFVFVYLYQQYYREALSHFKILNRSSTLPKLPHNLIRHLFHVHCKSYFIQFRTQTIGFVYMDCNLTSGTSEYIINDFYIQPEFRRHGIGAKTVRALWWSMPGKWKLRVANHNREALSFWQSIIQTSDQNYTSYEHEIESYAGVVFEFQITRKSISA